MKKFIKYFLIISGICFGLMIVFVVAVALFAANTTDAKPKKTPQELEQIKIEKAKAAEDKRIADSIAQVNKEIAIDKLKSFKVKKDEFDDLSFYKHKRVPYYSNVNFIYPYIGKKRDRYFLRLKFQYAANDWLFIEKIRIKTDNNNYTIYGEFERDHNSTIWEWLDMSPDEYEILMLRDMATSKKTTVRYVGKQYHKDRVMTKKEKDIIEKTLDIYKNL